MNKKSLEAIILMLKKGTDKESCFNYFYSFFRSALTKLKIKVMIDEMIIKKLDLRKQFIIEELNDNERDYSLPKELTEKERKKERKIIERIINKIRSNSYIEYETIKRLEQDEEITKLEEIIYKKIEEEFGNIDDEKIDSTNIKKQCIKALDGIKIHNENLIIDGKINERLYEEILEMLDEKTINEIEALIKLNAEKLKEYSEIQNKINQIQNISGILEQLTRKVIEEELKEIDKKLLKTILKKEYINEHAQLLQNEDFESDGICIGTKLPEYIKNYPEEIRVPLEYRCKLMSILDTISNKRSDNSELLKLLSEREEQELKNSIAKFLKQTNETLLNNYMKVLKQYIEEYINEKRKEIENHDAHIREIIEPTEAAIKSKKLESLKPLYSMMDTGNISPLSALFIYKILIDIENIENMESYRNLVYIVLSNEIQMFDDGIRIAIESIINDTYDEYFYNTKKNIKN